MFLILKYCSVNTSSLVFSPLFIVKVAENLALGKLFRFS